MGRWIRFGRLEAILFVCANMLVASPAYAQKITNCMSLMSPDMLFCTDATDRVLLCDVSGGGATCTTIPALYKSWRGHPERRETFYRKLYGAAQ